MNNLQVYCLKKDDSVNVLKSIIYTSKIYLDIDFFKYKNKIHTFGFKYFNYFSCVNKIYTSTGINIDCPDIPYSYFHSSANSLNILNPFYNNNSNGTNIIYGGCHYKAEDDIPENHVYKDIVKKTADYNVTHLKIKDENGIYLFTNAVKNLTLINGDLNRYIFYSTSDINDASESKRNYNFYQVLLYYTDVVIKSEDGYKTEKRCKVEFVYKDEL